MKKLTNMRLPMASFGALVLTLIMTVGAGYVFLGGSLDEGALLASEQVELAKELTRLTELVAAIRRGEETVESLQGGLEEIRNQIPAMIDFQGFYRDLTEITNKRGIRVYQVSPEEVEHKEGHDEMLVTITAQASFADFHAFLNDVSAQSRLTQLERLNVSPAGEAGLCDFEMSLFIFATGKEPGVHAAS